MARIFTWCDSPTAPTGFGRSAKHVLYALHEAGHELTQLAVNHDPADPNSAAIPWRVVSPTDRSRDPYGLRDLGQLLASRRFDAVWTTFDPEVPFRYGMADGRAALQGLLDLKTSNPGLAMLGWFPIDGGPLSDLELGQLGLAPSWDVTATMSRHVFDLMEWTLALKGQNMNLEAVEKRLLVIPHGVELDAYTIATAEQRAAAKAKMGFAAGTFVVLQLERNQQRKQNYLALEVMERLFAEAPQLRGRVALFQHMLENEEDHASGLGFNLPEMAWRYGLRSGIDVKWPGGFVPEHVLRELVYPAADAFLSVSTGEGFQYPAWEALACGLPLIVPNGDARRAWFKGVPNVHLYEMDQRRLVMRGGYHRRMGYARPEAAAKVLANVIKRGTTDQRREAGRAFVARVADHRNVAAEWVRLMGEQVQKVHELRAGARVADLLTRPEGVDVLVKIDGRPWGTGDLVIAAPALRALRASLNAEGRTLGVQLPLVPLAQALDVADWYVAEALPAGRAANLADLWQNPTPWHDPKVNRTDTVAEFLEATLGVKLGALRPAALAYPEAVRQQARARFLEMFGVGLESCVAVALESANPHRTFPEHAVRGVAREILARGLTPLVMGRAGLGIREVGMVNVTGGTDDNLFGVTLGLVRAVISTDAGALYVAAAQGVPVVGAFPTVSPAARLPWVGEAPRAHVVPPEGAEHGGQAWPPGDDVKAEAGVWSAYITPALLASALDELIGTAPPAPTILLPGSPK